MKTLVSLLAFALAGVEAREGVCNALVLSGGANNGAWEVGVLWGLVHYGNPADFEWQIVTGVSAGAINTGAISMFPPGEEVAMTEFLSDTIRSLTTTDVWIPRPGGKLGMVYSLFNEPSLIDDSPLVPTLRRIIEPFRETGIQRAFTLAAVDANTGEYVLWNNANTSYDDIPQACASSGSIPGAFQPQHFKGHVLMDGGTMWDVNIDSAVNYCLDQGYTQEQVVVDMLICGGVSTFAEPVYGSALKNWFDGHRIKSSYNQLNAIQAEMAAYPGINLRYFFQETTTGDYSASTGCPPYSELDFSDTVTWCLQEAGRRDAQNMLGLGQEKIQASLNEWLDDKKAQRDFPYFRQFLNNKFGI